MFFFLYFRIWKVFHWLFTFQSVCHVYLWVALLFLLPVIFIFRMLSNTENRLECFSYLVIRSNNIFQAHFYHLSLSLSYNADKIVCILPPDFPSYANFLHQLWVFLNSQRIQIDSQICSTQTKQRNFAIHNTEKKIWDGHCTTETKQTILTFSTNTTLTI